MAESLTSEQVRDKYLAAMSAPLGEAFYALYNQVAWLHSKWDDYDALFGEANTVTLLNDTAGPFFADIQRILQESILLHLCRLTDPPKSAGQDNLTLRRLPGLVLASSDISFHGSVVTAVDDAVAKTEFARVWRNKHLAHTTLPPSAGGKAIKLPVAGKAEIQSAIKSIGDSMNCLEHHYMKSTIGWDISLDTPLGVLQLVHYLERGLESQRKEDDEKRPWRRRPNAE